MPARLHRIADSVPSHAWASASSRLAKQGMKLSRPVRVTTWLTCGRTFPATQKCRCGAGRIDGARPAASMLLIHWWRRGPERVSRHVRETLAARGSRAVAGEDAGTGPGHPRVPG